MPSLTSGCSHPTNQACHLLGLFTALEQTFGSVPISTFESEFPSKYLQAPAPIRKAQRKQLRAAHPFLKPWQKSFTEPKTTPGRAIPRWGLAVSRSFGDLLLKEPQKYGCTKAGMIQWFEPKVFLKFEADILELNLWFLKQCKGYTPKN